MKRKVLQTELKTGFDINNPLVNAEDLKNHFGVGGVIHKGNKILIFYHKKYNFWTLPIGKVELSKDPSIGFAIEMREELGIDPICYRLLGTFYKTYNRGNNINTDIVTMIYDVYGYNGIVNNNEPNKHPVMTWMTISEIRRIQKYKKSDALKFYLNLRGILNDK